MTESVSVVCQNLVSVFNVFLATEVDAGEDLLQHSSDAMCTPTQMYH